MPQLPSHRGPFARGAQIGPGVHLVPRGHADRPLLPRLPPLPRFPLLHRLPGGHPVPGGRPGRRGQPVRTGQPPAGRGVAVVGGPGAVVGRGGEPRGDPSSPSSRRTSSRSARFQTAEPTTLKLRGPRRCTTPRTSSSQEWKTVWAQVSCESSKKARSTRPVPSSRVEKMTRRPERIGGVWVAALAPATSTVSPCRTSRSRRAETTPSSLRKAPWSSIRWREASMDSTPSSALSLSGSVRSGSPAGAVRLPPDSGSWSPRPPRAPRCSSVRCSCRSRRLAPNASSAPTWASRPASGRLGRARSQKSSSEAYGWPAAIRSASASLMPCTSESARRRPHTGSPALRRPLHTLRIRHQFDPVCDPDLFTSSGSTGTPAAARPPAAAASGTSRGHG